MTLACLKNFSIYDKPFLIDARDEQLKESKKAGLRSSLMNLYDFHINNKIYWLTDKRQNKK